MRKRSDEMELLEILGAVVLALDIFDVLYCDVDSHSHSRSLICSNQNDRQVVAFLLYCEFCFGGASSVFARGTCMLQLG